MGVQICESLLSVLLGIYPEVELLDHMRILCLNFLATVTQIHFYKKADHHLIFLLPVSQWAEKCFTLQCWNCALLTLKKDPLSLSGHNRRKAELVGWHWELGTTVQSELLHCSTFYFKLPLKIFQRECFIVKKNKPKTNKNEVWETSSTYINRTTTQTNANSFKVSNNVWKCQPSKYNSGIVHTTVPYT